MVEFQHFNVFIAHFEKVGLYWVWSVRNSVSSYVFCVTVFTGSTEATSFKLSVHMDNALLYRGFEIRTLCFYSSLYLSIFLSFQGKFVSQFSQELLKQQTSNMTYL